ncbi:TetR/AcrR family transcriptional regulator [Actinacidiphila sp. bgisy144]|uniref:TetR/AcrR family transcriptional regulator n=1 Tax=Actinacidiphila sp. bgisy144 TaxID=3413791 RepID=UPI003EB8D518
MSDRDRPASMAAVFVVAYLGLGAAAIVPGALTSAGIPLTRIAAGLALVLAALGAAALTTVVPPQEKVSRMQTDTRGTPRARLLSAAAELFYQEGIRSVGIGRLLEHAGVAKASLYDAFKSKDELVAAYLRDRYDGMKARFQRTLASRRDPRERALAPFDIQLEFAADSTYRGCAFARATAESHAAGVDTVASEYREWLRTTFTDLAAEAGAADPSAVAMQLHALWDGAAQSLQMDRDPAVVHATRDAAAALLDAALPATRTAP